MIDKQKASEKLKLKLETMTESPLYHYRKENNYQYVLGDGNLSSPIVFVGEAPGQKEAETGRPFNGAAGKMLDKLLESINLNRSDIYITNIVNDRPPKNRDPKPEEIELYAPILLELLTIIKPKVIVTLGRFSMTYLLTKFNSEQNNKSISELHGKVISINAPYGAVSLVPLYHPAFALYNGGMKATLLNDVQILKQFI